MQKIKEKILVITYWSYNDALIQTYTLPYLNIISTIITPDSKIFLVTLDKDSKQEKKSDSKIENISFRYKDFGFGGLVMWMGILLKLIRLIRKEKITTIHTWCTPAGAIGYLLSILTGRKLIIDSFEPHAVPMLESGTWGKNSLAYKILFKLEKLQLKRAAEVYRQAPEKFDRLVSLLTSFVDRPDWLINQSINLGGDDTKMILDCVIKIRGLAIQEKMKKLTFELKNKVGTERMQQLMQEISELKKMELNLRLNFRK